MISEQINPQPIVNQKPQAKKENSTNFDISLTLGDDGGQQIMSSLEISVCSYISTNIIQIQKKLLQQIQSKQKANQDLLIVFKFIVQRGRQKDAMEFLQKGLDQQQNDMNISAFQTLFHRPKSAGQIQIKQFQGSILVIYRLYKEYLHQMEQLFQYDKIGSIVNIDFNFKLILKGTILPCKKSYAALKPDYININITSNKIRVVDFITTYIRQKGGDENQYNNDDFMKLWKNLYSVKMSLKFNSLRKFIDYYDRILEYNIPVDQNGNKIYDDQDKIFNNNVKEFPLLNKGIFKEKVQCKIIYSNKLALNAVLTYKNEEVLFKMVSVLKNAFQKENI